jgi:hypothetical protein
MGYYNRNNNENQYVRLYNDWLPVFVMTSSIVGVFAGVCTATHYQTKEIFPIIMGYSSLGLITGITFPFSFPLLGGYVLYKYHK